MADLLFGKKAWAALLAEVVRPAASFVWRGCKIYEQDGRWYFLDTNEAVATTWKRRACGYCNMKNTLEGHDGCIGHLPGVMNACCGHGEQAAAYIQFPDGSIIRGLKAIKRMNDKAAKAEDAGR